MDRPVRPTGHSIPECRERIAAFDARAGHMTFAAILSPGVTLALYTFLDGVGVMPRSVLPHVLPFACVLLGVVGASLCLRAARTARRRARALEARIVRRERDAAS